MTVRVQRLVERQVLDIPGVTGVGSSEQVTVFVERVTPEIERRIRERIGTEVAGFPVRLISTGRLVALQTRTDRWRPALGGISVGCPQVTAGTLGTPYVEDNKTGDRVFLSNCHVLANSDYEGASIPRAEVDMDALQPGPFDGGSTADRLGGLLRWEKLRPAGTNYVDAAVALPDDSSWLRDDILEIGETRGDSQVTEGTPIMKSGRTTAVTSAPVVSASAMVMVGGYPDDITVTFQDQIVIKGPYVARGGDSGSLGVVPIPGSKYAVPVGLLFAGSEESTPPEDWVAIFNKIGRVESALDVTMPGVIPAPGGRTLAGMAMGASALGLGAMVSKDLGVWR